MNVNEKDKKLFEKLGIKEKHMDITGFDINKIDKDLLESLRKKADEIESRKKILKGNRVSLV
jgi:hypothetical protein